MCIKIVKNNISASYDVNVPLEKQLANSTEIVIDYQPNHPEIEKFLNEIDRFSKTGLECTLNIKVKHNDNIFGAKVKKKAKKLKSDIALNEIIKLMVLSHLEVDSKLKDLADFCLNKVCNE